MMNLEQELARALKRRSPRPGFADRVAARIEQDQSRGRSAPGPSTGWITFRRIAAAVILLAVLGGLTIREVHQRRERAAGEQARRDVLVALHIASAKVRAAQREVRSIGIGD